MSERPDFVRVSVPGRTELGGNHTDHQHGHVLAAAIDRRMTGTALRNGTGDAASGGVVNVLSEGFPVFSVRLSELAPVESEKGKSVAIVRGMVAGQIASGCPVEGFDIRVSSQIPVGGGLSSSAAFEVLFGVVMESLFEPQVAIGDSGRLIDPLLVALRGVAAERTYFGKPCGAMDQVACASEGAVAIDFKDPDAPVVTPVTCDFSRIPYSLCLIDTGIDHSQFTAMYAQIASDMCDVARYLGAEVLRDVDEREFDRRFRRIVYDLGRRKALRALHFFREEERVALEVAALDGADFKTFLEQVRKAEESSENDLCNIGMARTMLEGCRAVLPSGSALRIHGGGFGGSLQAWVPTDSVDGFLTRAEALAGPGGAEVYRIGDGPRVEEIR